MKKIADIIITKVRPEEAASIRRLLELFIVLYLD